MTIINRTNEIKSEIQSISVGYTSTVFGIPVTRWTKNQFEVGILNKSRCSLSVAANKILAVIEAK